jgi:acyl-CoA reductase-like NAD-dependent aldehyde dehydrogenase
MKPSLFVDVDNSMTIASGEIFGPVLVVLSESLDRSIAVGDGCGPVPSA